VKTGDCFKAAGYRNPFLRRFYIRSGVSIDDTIAIENDQLHGSRLRGATVNRLETSGSGGDDTGERACVMSYGNGVDPAAALKRVK
jgi:hypothetical protein